jgi:hypothetical protein
MGVSSSRPPAHPRLSSIRLPAAATMLLSYLNVSMARSPVGFGGMRDWTDAASGIGSVGPFTFLNSFAPNFESKHR